MLTNYDARRRKTCSFCNPALNNIHLHIAAEPHYLSGVKRKETIMDIRKTLRKWSAYNQTVRELNALGNRDLGDLGINRADIQRIAREHAASL